MHGGFTIKNTGKTIIFLLLPHFYHFGLKRNRKRGERGIVYRSELRLSMCPFTRYIIHFFKQFPIAMRYFLLLLTLNLLPVLGWSQKAGSEPDSTQVEETEVPLQTQVGETTYKGRTIPHIVFPTLPKYAPMEFKNEKERERYNRLVYNVKKVLPWAKLTKYTILETYDYLETLPDEKARKAHIKRWKRD